MAVNASIVSTGPVRRSLLGICAVALAACCAVTEAATIVERRIDLSLEGPAMVESLHLVVALEEPGDLTAWSEYDIDLDDHVELVRASARVVEADGQQLEAVPRRRWREES